MWTKATGLLAAVLVLIPAQLVRFPDLSTRYLKPAFADAGSVTAGNSCPLSDGAAAVLVMSEERARGLGLRPRARVLASAVSGVELRMGHVDARGAAWIRRWTLPVEPLLAQLNGTQAFTDILGLLAARAR